MNSLPESIQTELARLDTIKSQVTELAEHAEKAHAAVAMFPDLNARVSVVHWTCQLPFVCVAIDVSNFRELTPLFRELAKLGLHTDKDKPYADCVEIERRTYNLGECRRHPIYGDNPDGKNWPLRIHAFPVKDGATCKRVQTGTKEEPVYEFVCE